MNRPFAAGGLLALCLALASLAQAQGVLTPQQIAQRSRLATVQIRSLDASGEVNGSGSGFFARADGTIITNFHVIEDAHSLQVEQDSGEVFDNVYFVSADPRRDTAILKIPVTGVPVLPLGTDSSVDIGSRIYVMGNPLGQTATFSDGLVSARRVTNGVRLLQVTAPISPGSSGGPAMNERGEVIGIATMFLEGGQNLNFLVPVDHITPMLSMGDTPRRFNASLLPRTGGGLADLTGGSGSAPVRRPPTDVEAALRQLYDGLAAQFRAVERADDALKGYHESHEPTYGLLDMQEQEDVRVDLDAGHSHVFVALCDNDCDDVDLALYDTRGERVRIDDDETALAAFGYRATASGEHVFRVTMYSCTREPCAYGVKVYEKD